MSIIVEQVSKRYWLQGAAPRTFQQTLGQILHTFQRGTPFWALQNVSLRIENGEAVGLIGHNGAGKSTLLRLICGLGRPTTGRTKVEGRVAALLDLSAGFHPQLTGRENLYVSGVISGLRKAEVTARFDDIVRFAEIEQFIDQPLRTYSSGMQVRLAFAVAIHVDPDVLIVDEALAVGDADFQKKCLKRIESFQQRGKTLVIVSHNMEMINRFCNRAIWLEHGKVIADGPVEQVTKAYTAKKVALPPPTGSVLEGLYK